MSKHSKRRRSVARSSKHSKPEPLPEPIMAERLIAGFEQGKRYLVGCYFCGKPIIINSLGDMLRLFEAQFACKARGVIEDDEHELVTMCPSCAAEHAGPDWEALGHAIGLEFCPICSAKTQGHHHH